MNPEKKPTMDAPAAPAPFDVESVRREFPLLHDTMRGRPLVYLDNAATTQKPQAVIEAIDHYYRHENANVHRGVYQLSESATEKYEAVRDRVKAFINARSRNEVIFTRGTTEAINLVASSFGSTFGQEDEILISAMEHHSNIVPWQLLAQRTGATLRVVPISEHGELLTDDFHSLLCERTRLVALAHVSNALGTINPIAELIAAARDCGARVLIDGAQAVAHTRVDVQQLGCDFYAFSGHKMFGPTGIGVLYGREQLLDAMPPYQGGGEMIQRVTFEKTDYAELPHKFEAGTPHIAGTVGLGAALDFLARFDFEAIEHHEQRLLARATALAADFPGLRIIGTARHKAAVLSFLLADIHAHDLSTLLDHEGIAVRAGHHCAMPVMDFFRVPATVRASFALYNTEAEVDHLFDALRKVKQLWN